MKRSKSMVLQMFLLVFCSAAMAVEFGTFRLLSVSESEKLVLVSQISSKSKFLLDASSAKITVNGKPAEYKALKSFSIILVKMESRKFKKNGIQLDGLATEIRIGTNEKSK